MKKVLSYLACASFIRESNNLSERLRKSSGWCSGIVDIELPKFHPIDSPCFLLWRIGSRVV